MGKTKMNKPAEELIAEYEREISRLEIEIGKKRAQIEAVRALQARAGGTPAMAAVPSQLRQRARRGDLKSIVLKLLEERGAHGLNAAIAAELTAKRGDPIDRNSVSSLLSRLKTDGVVNHVGNVYKLAGIKDVDDVERVH